MTIVRVKWSLIIMTNLENLSLNGVLNFYKFLLLRFDNYLFLWIHGRDQL